MAIQNGIGFTRYQRTMDHRIAGTPAEADLPKARPYVNPKPAQVTTLSVGTFDTDTDSVSFTVTEPDGTVHGPYTVLRAAGAPADPNAAAAALVALVDDDSGALGVFTAEADTNDVILSFDHAGIAYDVTPTASAGTTFTAALTTDPAGASVPIGRFVIDNGTAPDGGRQVALPDGSAETAIVGVTMRPLGMFENLESSDSADDDSIPPGRMCDVAREGAVNVLNVGGDAPANGSVFVVVNTAGGDALGQARGDDDGANAVQLPARNGYWIEATPSGQVGPVYLRL